MKSAKRIRTGVLVIALSAVAGVMAVLACGPSAPAQQPGSASAVAENASVPATEAPFVVQQSGGGGGTGGQGEPTEEPTGPPTADETETPTPTVDVASSSRVGYRLKHYYHFALEDNAGRAARGEDPEFPVKPVFVKTTREGEHAVASFLEANGGRRVFKEPDAAVSAVVADINIGIIPELLGVDGFIRVDLDIHSAYRIPPVEKLVDPDSGALSQELRLAYRNVRDRIRRTESRSPELADYPVLSVSIVLWRESHYDRVLGFLKANGAQNITGDRDGDGDLIPSLIEADISLGLVEELSDVVGVYRVERVQPSSDGPSTGSRTDDGTSGRAETIMTPTPTKLPAVVSMRADQWHRAGFTGSGVEVAVIDRDFRQFRTRVLPHLSGSVKFLCYGIDANGDPVVREGEISVATAEQGGTPAGYFDACETADAPGDRPHGTDVVATFFEIAPGAKFYLSNAREKRDKVEVLKWLTGGVEDNVIGVAQYRVLENDDFDVKIINHSIDGLWDGLGDGTSPFDGVTDRSLLNIVRDSVGKGVLWVNVAGNQGHWTWFANSPIFDGGNVGSLEYRAGETCNRFYVGEGVGYLFQARWYGQWPKEDTNIDLLLYEGTGTTKVPATRGVTEGNIPQSGKDGTGADGIAHYPHETLVIEADALTPGFYCVDLELKSGTPPDWVQLQMFWGGGELEFTTDRGSLTNPAESAKDEMLSVGFTNDVGMDVDGMSSRGPAPEPVGRRALDLVAPGFNPGDPEGVAGTSFAAPRVAGLAALVIGALSDRPEFDELGEIVKYLKEYGSADRGSTSGCNHEWGCGFAIAPALDPPADLELEHDGGCGILRVRSTLPAPPFRARKSDYVYDLKEVGTPDRDVSSLRIGLSTSSTTGNLRGRFAGGKTYEVEAYGCALGVPGERLCGAVSETSNQVTLPQTVCKLKNDLIIRGRRIHTLVWNLEPNATGYEVEELVDGEYVPLSTTTSGHLVVEGRSHRERYYYRVRAKGPSGDSDWVRLSAVGGGGSGSSKPTVTDVSADDFLTQSDALLRWYRGDADALYEVGVFDETSRDWRTLPFRPAGWSEQYGVEFEYSPQSVFDPGPVVVGKLTGLVPGTDYQVRVRSRNGDVVSDWSDTVTVTTLGTRLPNALKTPPSGLTTSVSGTDVNLSWTAGENPNYVHQLVRRRVVGVDPLVWTDVEVGVEVAEYADTTAAAGTEYVYLIRAVKSNGGTTDSKGSSILVAPAPRNLAATVSGTTVSLTWDAHNNPNHERQVLLRRVAGERPFSWTEFSVGLNDTSYSDATAVSGTKYIYRLRVMGPNGKDLDSQPMAVTVP